MSSPTCSLMAHSMTRKYLCRGVSVTDDKNSSLARSTATDKKVRKRHLISRQWGSCLVELLNFIFYLLTKKNFLPLANISWVAVLL